MVKEFKSLLQAISKSETIYKEDDLQFVEDNMSAFPEYVDAVYRQTVLTPIYYARYEGEELRDAVKEMDYKRRICHESAIAACSQLNRICEEYHVTPFCPNTQDRYEIADFCAQITTAFYLDGLNKDAKDIDNVISEMKKMGKTINNHLDINEYLQEDKEGTTIDEEIFKEDDELCL